MKKLRDPELGGKHFSRFFPGGDDIHSSLEKHNSALCLFDLAGTRSPIELTADFTYIRLHGPGGKYHGSYDEATLHLWADRIRKLAPGGFLCLF